MTDTLDIRVTIAALEDRIRADHRRIAVADGEVARAQYYADNARVILRQHEADLAKAIQEQAQQAAERTR